MTSAMYEEHGRSFLEKPWRWRRQLLVACLALGSPLITVPLVLSTLHFVAEARFNRTLLKDVTSHPMLRVPELA
jgi:hypothetical protein